MNDLSFIEYDVSTGRRIKKVQLQPKNNEITAIIGKNNSFRELAIKRGSNHKEIAWLEGMHFIEDVYPEKKIWIETSNAGHLKLYSLEGNVDRLEKDYENIDY